VTETEGGNASSIELTADIASAYVSNNVVAASDLPGLITAIFGALTSVGAEEPAEPQQPAVPIKKSIIPDYLICLEDGRRFKSLKRHLSSKYGLSAEAYRAKWALPKDYPMVAPAYSAARSALARQFGLGQGGPSAGRSSPSQRRRRLRKRAGANPSGVHTSPTFRAVAAGRFRLPASRHSGWPLWGETRYWRPPARIAVTCRAL
jgi:predicted transcriptional regulator